MLGLSSGSKHGDDYHEDNSVNPSCCPARGYGRTSFPDHWIGRFYYCGPYLYRRRDKLRRYVDYPRQCRLGLVMPGMDDSTTEIQKELKVVLAPSRPNNLASTAALSPGAARHSHVLIPLVSAEG